MTPNRARLVVVALLLLIFFLYWFGVIPMMWELVIPPL